MKKVLYLSFLWFWIALPQFAFSVSVRLVGGNSFEGRVEVQYNGEWGTVCNNNWDMNDANVVCRMLGYQRALATASQFGQGSGRIWLDRVTCFGSESSIDRCCHRGWGTHSCGHYQDAGVVCQPKVAYTNVRVRLTNNTVRSYAGQVQVRYYGVWKPICDYSWDKQDGNVVCRMMGYTQGAAAAIKRIQGSSNVWLSYVYCGGYENSIGHCHTSTWGQTSCSDNRLAGVICISGTPNIAFRLTSTIIPNEGRLEVRYYGIWGTVCTYFDQKDAHVVCRMLGYSQAALTYKQPHTTGMYRFSLNMHCNGQENSTDQCGYYINEINACENWDVWVVCKSSVYTNITVRLVDGTTPNEGRVEVGYQGTWGTVCSYYWTLRDAHVVCRMLNYSKASREGTATVKGSGPIHAFGNCKGNEKSLEYCDNYHWSWHYCYHSSDVEVTCVNMTKEEKSIDVRLVGFDQDDTGLVEVNYNGTWRPICDDYSWDILDAHVVCRMLGYKAALAPLRQYRRQHSNIWMAGVECSGAEGSISECYHDGWSTTYCSGSYRAGVVCEAEEFSPVQVRLEDGGSQNSGRVAVRYGNIWGFICPWGIDMNDARVICRMLGYPGATQITYMYNYSPGNNTMWLNYLECNGTEKSIADCRRPRWGQRCHWPYYLTGVICKKADAPQFQISGTNGITDSTVEILFNVSHPLGTQLQNLATFSAYQVVVKLRDIQYSSKSHGQPDPLTIKEVDYGTALELGYDSYIAAEILGPNVVPNLTIGDGQYYHGYYNAPLRPERTYRIYVRAVTKTSHGKRVYGDSAFVSFETKPKADAPQFRINGKDAITDSSVKILFNDSQPTETQRTSVYQVAVEKRQNDRFYSSYDQAEPFIFRDVNVTMAMEKHYENYLTAEIVGPVSNLTIGDGQYYHGYYNAPLEPGCSYKIHVRTVKRSASEKQFYGHSSYVAFTTKQFAEPNAAKSTDKGNEKAPVIGLSVVVVVLILLVIGAIVWFILKKRRASEDGTTNEMSEIQAQPYVTPGLPESDYQSLNFSYQTQGKGGFNNPAYNMIDKKKQKKGKKSETSPEPTATENQVPESHYQSLSFPRGQVNGGYDNQEQAYHVSNVSLQNSDGYKVNGGFYENATC